MKVVLFCGGFGMRMRDYSESIPKPLVTIGPRPVLWHLMKYYAHFGHTEFILCLGWKASAIKEYFLTYNECLSNDFIMDGDSRGVHLLSRDMENWSITFCDTGTSATIGERLMSVRDLVGGAPTFLANYTDGLTDLCLDRLVDFHHQQSAVATFLSVKPTQSFHKVELDDVGRVSQVQPIGAANVWMNGGYFVFSNSIFDHLKAGEDMVDGAFNRLIDRGECYSMRHEGYWGCMDTYKEMQQLQEMYDKGNTPWAVWETKATRKSPTNGNSQTLTPTPIQTS